MQKIRFRKRSNHFLGTLKKEISKITSQKNLIIPVDKTTKYYLVPPEKYQKMVDKEIHKNYRKENPRIVKRVEHGSAW